MAITTLELMDKINEVKAGTMKNASSMKIDKNGIGIEYECAGKKVQVVVDRDLPSAFIFTQIESLFESIEKDVKARMD